MRALKRARLILFLGLAIAGCSASRVVLTARQGDLAALKAEIANAQRSGRLDEGAVTSLARAVARREVASARGEQSIERVRQARLCLGAVESEVRDRSRRHDDAGAAATLLLLDQRKLGPEGLYQRYRRSESGAWRAVAARVAVDARRGPARRRYFVDVDERVRRAALRAAFDASEGGDVPALLEAARLDPDPLSRSLALRALGKIGGRPVVLGLLDLWSRAAQADRLAILEAWAGPGAWRSGGRARLMKVAESENGLVAVAAAASLVRQLGGEAGLGVLVRAVRDGAPAEQEVAISALPLESASAVQALRYAAERRDGLGSVLADVRLTEVAAERARAMEALRAVAVSGGEGAKLARTHLAKLKDRTPIPLFKRDLTAPVASDREAAAIGLLRLRRHADLATALGDDSGRVRMAVACAVIFAP